jgi:predicted signal transduction protein with EAL and GGDEF domain
MSQAEPPLFSQDLLSSGNEPSHDDAAASAHLQAVLNSMAAGLLTFNRALALLFSNDKLAPTLEIDPAVAARAASLLDVLEASAVLDDGLAQGLHEACLTVINTSVPHSSTLSVPSGPTTRFFSVEIVPLTDSTWMASFKEITAQRAAEAGAIESAMRDPLTGLPNRQLFQNRVAAALTAADRSPSQDEGSQDGGSQHGAPAVMLVDLDRFKPVNDTLGHAIGDGLLRLVSKRLRSVVRQEDAVAPGRR